MASSISGRHICRFRMMPNRRKARDLGSLNLTKWLAMSGIALLMTSGIAVGAEIAPAENHTLGFVLTYWGLASYQTDSGAEECGNGIAASTFANFEAQYPEKEQRDEFFRRAGARSNRGADGASDYWYPMTANDPVEHRTVTGKKALGMNLDGNEDGQSTTTTCAHEDFVDLDGNRGIDNQLYRLFGCSNPFRKGGIFEAEFRTATDMPKHMNRILLEVSGVDDVHNDDSVDVSLFVGKDLLVKDSVGQPVAWTTQRIDSSAGMARYRVHVKGKIVDGVLLTDPVDLRLPEARGGEGATEHRMMDARIKLRMDGANGEAIIGGYVDMDHLWTEYSKIGAKWVTSTATSAPALYRAMKRLADGRKDPATGQCTALSGAYKTTWVRAYVVHEKPEQVSALQ